MTKRVAIIVEGDTEFYFVGQVLQAAIADIALSPINLRGGTINTDRLVDKALDLSRDKFDGVSTLVDFYQFKGVGGRKVEEIEDEMRQRASKLSMGKTRFLPYVQQYEFEALLFADKSKISARMEWKGAPRKALTAIRGEPENINHKEPPSVRIRQICDDNADCRRYRKITDGIAIIEDIGLDRIRQKCPRFGGWFKQLSAFAKQ